MSRSRVLPIASVAFGAANLIFGLALVAMYVHSAVIEPLGEPDQSLLFWLIPFLLIGLAASAFGIAAVVLGVIGIRRRSVPVPVEQVRPTDDPR